MTAQNVVFGQRYRVQRELGRGGMGAVFLAEDTRLPGRLVAVKENTDGVLGLLSLPGRAETVNTIYLPPPQICADPSLRNGYNHAS